MKQHLWVLALVTACAGGAAQADTVVRDDALTGPAVRTASRWTPSAWSTDQYETTPTFSPDGSAAIFMRADRSFGSYRLLESECIGGHWTAPREPGFASEAAMHDGDPFLSPDGKSLYFISTRHRFAEVGNEDFDIHVVSRDQDGAWGVPERLPAPVNSESSELLPSLDRAGNLYFGSDRPGGHGGTDIYLAVRDATGKWSVVNVDAVNTAANDFEAEVSADGSQLAVVSDRDVRSRLYLYRRSGNDWTQGARVHANDAVFQVGPKFAPDGKRLLFGQDEGQLSGEIYLLDLAEGADSHWPPRCESRGMPGD